ncbi:MAG: glycoside hydrolase family 2 TIM barrel-domain containing protein, partial [Deinococcota bacterium]
MQISLTNWYVRTPDTTIETMLNKTLKASVPGCVHTDLLAHNLINDPYLDQNEHDVQWISLTDWDYSTTFEVTAEHLEMDRLELVCLGLDTIATLYINDQEIAKTYNMHRAYRFDVKPHVQLGQNTLTIHFAAPQTWSEAQRDKLGDLPNAYSVDNAPYNFIRKMACNYGWDWGPRLTTVGIWQPIYLEAWNTARIESVRPLISLNEDLSQAQVDINVSLDKVVEASDVTLEVHLSSPTGETVYVGSALTFEVDNPDLWFPAGYGEQPLYTLRLELKQGTHLLDEWETRLGFRKVVLDTSLDDIGSAFCFIINNRPVFIKGANWIPDDCFPTRVDKVRYRTHIMQARDANMNMLRVWGGGIYEQDDFYDLCDELGILVWQDFLFACAAYPEEEPYWSEVAAEARYQVTRLSPHPSLVLWNGNNENLWGYVSWDWQPQLEQQNGSHERTWGRGYYLDLLPNIVNELDPSRPYWPGSPYSGSMDIHPLADNFGCKHVWDAWNQTDYSMYRAYIPRFVSEFGHQAPPSFATLLESISERPLKPDSPAVLHHQKAINGNDKLHARLSEHFPVPEDIHLWHYATQLNQARAMEYGVSHWRSHAPTCMGTLYWQLNDCWPVTSWAAVDGYGRKKPLWYASRRFYADKLMTIQPRGSQLALIVINDSDTVWQDTITVQRYSFAGEVLYEQTYSIDVPTRQNYQLLLDDGFHAYKKDAELIRAKASTDDGTADAWWFFDIDKRLDYPVSEYQLDVTVAEEGYTLNVTAQTFLRDVVVYADKLEPIAEVSE